MSERLLDDLWVAVWEGSVEEVQSLLDQGADPNDQLYWRKEWKNQEHGIWMKRLPPLHTACFRGNVEIVQMLVQNGADVDKIDSSLKETPVFQACRRGHTEVVVYMVREARCNITDVWNKKKETPLHLACVNEGLEMVQCILEESKCDVELRDNTGRTPLHWACWAGQKEIVQLLVEKGRCRIDVSDWSGKTPLSWAVRYGRTEIVDYLKSLLKESTHPEHQEQFLEQDLESELEGEPVHAILKKDASGFGFLIVGGYRPDSVVSIGRITPGGSADRDGRIRVGDVLVKINGVPVVKYTLDQAVTFVNSLPSDFVASFELRRGILKEEASRCDKPDDTPLSQEEVNVLNTVLTGVGIKPIESSLGDSQPSLESFQELLLEKGYSELATNLRAKLNEVIQLQEQYSRKLAMLMADEDTIDICYLKAFMIGPPGVGKTTTLNRLLKEYENVCTAGEKAKRRSTLLTNCTQVLAFIDSDETADWLSSNSKDEEAVLLIRYLCGDDIKLQSSPKESTLKSDPLPLQDKSVAAGSVEIKKSQKLKGTVSKPFSLHQQAGPQVKADKKEKLLAIKDQLHELVRSGNFTKAVGRMGNTLLNINDVGGQPSFLEMLPALSTGPAIYLVFFDLTKELNKLYEITFDRDNTVITPFQSLHTVESTISQILSAIASAHHISREPASFDLQRAGDFSEKLSNFQKMQPVAALIGTHLDRLDDPETKIEHTSIALETVTEKFKSIVVTPPKTTTAVAASGQSSSPSSPPFFTVNNYDGEEREDIAPIRNFMNKIIGSRFRNASLPIQKKWLILNIILRREYHIVEVKECIEIGAILGMNVEEVKFCLWYLNCIGTLMHYTDIADDEDEWFKNHIICSPQVIFDSISQLIVECMQTLHCEDHVTEQEKEELIRKGQFSIESIEMYSLTAQVMEKLQNKELIPVKQLIHLLKNVNLLSPIIHKEATGTRVTYLMPAILESAPFDELTTPPPPDVDNPEPLLITFCCGYVPTGTFCGLITQLVSRDPDKILGFAWDLVEDGVKRNCVSFYVDFVNKVTLICHDQCYEVRVTRKDPDIPLRELCAYVLSALLYLLNDIYKKLTPQIAFQCPCPKHATCKGVTNTCTLVDVDRRRFLCERQPVTLRDSQQVWLGDHLSCFTHSANTEGSKDSVGVSSQPVVVQKDNKQPTPQGTLTLKEVKKMIHHARAKWFDLGIELDIDLFILEEIRSRNHYVVDDCFTEMLSHWLSQSSSPRTKDELIEALKSPTVGRADLAKIVECEDEPPKCDTNHHLLTSVVHCVHV